MQADELAVIRTHYAAGLRPRSNLKSRALVEALASVPRERFLGPPPWTVLGHGSPATGRRRPTP